MRRKTESIKRNGLQAEEMINEIRTAFKDNFKNLKWMDKETLIEAEKKADAITDMIGDFFCFIDKKKKLTLQNPLSVVFFPSFLAKTITTTI